MKQKTEGRGGAAEQKVHRHTFRLTESQNTRFCNMMMQAGTTDKSRFIVGRIFGWPFKVVKIDKTALDYYTRLTAILAQMRSVGVNYNQVVKAIHTNFSERRAAALLARLEKHTQEFCELERQAINLTREYRAKWSEE